MVAISKHHIEVIENINERKVRAKNAANEEKDNEFGSKR